jgi:hypothetical protein
MPRACNVAALIAVAIPFVVACRDVSAPTVASRPSAPSFDVITTEVERFVTDEEFALADADKVAGVCMKGTSSTNLVIKDANPATPSQPCPPAWTYTDKPSSIKLPVNWETEDKNRNGYVCVKYVGDVGTSKSVVKDDNLSTPSQPCPPSFTYVGKPPSGPKVDADDVAAADDDGDGMVCVNAVASGNFIVRDDNNATPSQPCPPSWYVFGAKGGGGADPAEPAQPAAD